MNRAYFLGKIIEISDYRFFFNSKKHDSKISFKIETLRNDFRKGDFIECDAYDKIADKIYRFIEKYNLVFVEGTITKNMKVDVFRIEKIYYN